MIGVIVSTFVGVGIFGAIVLAGKHSVWNHPNMPAKSKRARDNHMPYNL